MSTTVPLIPAPCFFFWPFAVVAAGTSGGSARPALLRYCRIAGLPKLECADPAVLWRCVIGDLPRRGPRDQGSGQFSDARFRATDCDTPASRLHHLEFDVCLSARQPAGGK